MVAIIVALAADRPFVGGNFTYLGNKTRFRFG